MANQTTIQQGKNNNQLDAWSILVMVIIVGLAYGSCVYMGSSDSSSSTHVEINSQYHMTSGAVGFSSKDSLERYMQYYQQNDETARMTFLKLHVATGDAVIFDGGETVIVTELSPLSGMAKIRITGSYSEYWVYTVWLE